MAKTFKVGEKYIVTDLDNPVLAEVVVLTTEPGKAIGLKLPHQMEGAHTLDGRVEPGLGWWAHPSTLATDAEFKAQALAKQAVAVTYPETAELVYDEVTGTFSDPTAAPTAESKAKSKK